MTEEQAPKKNGRFLKILVGLLMVLVVVTVCLLLFIDPVVRTAIERGGTFALGVDTKIASLNLGLVSGQTGIQKLTVSNPEGFDTDHFLQLGTGRVVVALPSLLRDEVVVSELSFSNISLNLEQKGDRKNYQTILDNLGRFQDTDRPGGNDRKEPAKTDRGKRVIIKRLSIKDVQVQFDLLPIGGQLRRIPVRIDRIELENVGSGSQHGSLVMELSSILIKSILTAVSKQAGDVIPQAVLAELDKGLKQFQDIGTVTSKITKDIHQQVDQIGQQIGETGKKVGQQLDQVGNEVGQGLNNLLNGGKKK